MYLCFQDSDESQEIIYYAYPYLQSNRTFPWTGERYIQSYPTDIDSEPVEIDIPVQYETKYDYSIYTTCKY